MCGLTQWWLHNELFDIIPCFCTKYLLSQESQQVQLFWNYRKKGQNLGLNIVAFPILERNACSGSRKSTRMHLSGQFFVTSKQCKLAGCNSHVKPLDSGVANSCCTQWAFISHLWCEIPFNKIRTLRLEFASSKHRWVGSVTHLVLTPDLDLQASPTLDGRDLVWCVWSLCDAWEKIMLAILGGQEHDYQAQDQTSTWLCSIWDKFRQWEHHL